MVTLSELSISFCRCQLVGHSNATEKGLNLSAADLPHAPN